MLRAYSRPFDPTSKAVSNLILGEEIPLSILDKYAFIPSLGSFYTDTLVVRHAAKVLTRNKDYDVLLLNKEATEQTAKEVAVCIRMLDTSYTDITIDYQCVGGHYQQVVNVLKAIKENSGGKLINPIKWKYVTNKPEKFNPSSHHHPAWEVLGWNGWTSSLSQLRLAILRKQLSKQDKVFDYLDGKLVEHKTVFNAGVKRLTDRAEKLAYDSRYPLGYILSSKGPYNFKEGVWQQIPNNSVLYGVNSNDMLGVNGISFSKDITYPQPDNILLDTDGIPIITNDVEWIYLDDEFPAVVRSVDPNYSEPIDEVFDILAIRHYVKVAHTTVPSYVLGADRTNMKDGDMVFFTVKTTSVDKDTLLDYTLTGVGPSNVNVPTTGTIAVNQYGVATLAVKLVEGSLPTYNSLMTFTVKQAGDLSVGVNYKLRSNAIANASVSLVRTTDEVALDEVIYGDKFWVCITHPGVDVSTATLVSNLPDNVNYQVDGKFAPKGNDRAVTINLDVGVGKTFVPIKTLSEDNLSNISGSTFSVRIEDKTFTSNVIKFSNVTMDAWVFDNRTNERIDTVAYNQKFKVYVAENSKDSLACPISFVANAISGNVTPQQIPDVYVDWRGIGNSVSLMVKSPANPIDSELIINVGYPNRSKQVYPIKLKIKGVV